MCNILRLIWDRIPKIFTFFALFCENICIIQIKVVPLQPQNDSKVKVSSLALLADAMFGHVS